MRIGFFEEVEMPLLSHSNVDQVEDESENNFICPEIHIAIKDEAESPHQREAEDSMNKFNLIGRDVTGEILKFLPLKETLQAASISKEFSAASKNALRSESISPEWTGKLDLALRDLESYFNKKFAEVDWEVGADQDELHKYEQSKGRHQELLANFQPSYFKNHQLFALVKLYAAYKQGHDISKNVREGMRLLGELEQIRDQEETSQRVQRAQGRFAWNDIANQRTQRAMNSIWRLAVGITYTCFYMSSPMWSPHDFLPLSIIFMYLEVYNVQYRYESSSTEFLSRNGARYIERTLTRLEILKMSLESALGTSYHPLRKSECEGAIVESLTRDRNSESQSILQEALKSVPLEKIRSDLNYLNQDWLFRKVFDFFGYNIILNQDNQVPGVVSEEM